MGERGSAHRAFGSGYLHTRGIKVTDKGGSSSSSLFSRSCGRAPPLSRWACGREPFFLFVLEQLLVLVRSSVWAFSKAGGVKGRFVPPAGFSRQAAALSSSCRALVKLPRALQVTLARNERPGPRRNKGSFSFLYFFPLGLCVTVVEA